jgi:hypothetical protein
VRAHAVVSSRSRELFKSYLSIPVMRSSSCCSCCPLDAPSLSVSLARSSVGDSVGGWCATKGSSCGANLAERKRWAGGRPRSCATCTARPPREAAWRRCRPDKNSARVTPKDHMSMAWRKGRPKITCGGGKGEGVRVAERGAENDLF